MSQKQEDKLTEDDLATNPFLALFPSLKHAEDYIRSNQTDSTLKIIQGDFQTNVTDASESNITKEQSNEWQQKSQIINDFLQRVFLITVNPDKKQSGWRNYDATLPDCVLLKGLYKEMKDKKDPLLITSDNLNQAIMERLSLSHFSVVSYGKKSKQSSNEGVSATMETLLIKFLAHSLQRLHSEEANIKRKLKDLSVVEEIEGVKSVCESLIFSYAGSILVSPEVFDTEDPSKQLVNLLLKPDDCRYVKEFLDGIVQNHDDSHDLTEMFNPLLDGLMDSIKSVTLMNPEVFTVLDILIYFSKNLKLGSVLVSNSNWLRPVSCSASSTAGLDFERLTLLGPLLGATTLSYNINQPSEFFNEPSRQSQIEMEAVMNNCRRQIDLICSGLHQVFRNVLENKEIKQDLLYWIGACLHHNRKRSQLSFETGFASMLTQARDGFFLNLSNVLLKLCDPFLELSEKSRKSLKINSRYCCVETSISDIASPNARIHLVQSLEDPRVAQKTDDMDIIDADGLSFNFVTECFFLTHKCLKIGFLKAANSYHSLMKNLQKLSEIYRDARASNFHSEEMERIKSEFEQKIQKQLSFKAHLLNPSLAELVVKFCSVTCYWLTQQLLADENFNDGQHRELEVDNLHDKVYPALTIIPEYIVENVADSMIFMEHFGDEIIEKSGHLLENVMVFFSLFMGSSKRLNNPHLRAKLSEALAGLLPRQKQDELGRISVSMNAGCRIFENSLLVSQILPEALLKLFVDIEYTGHSMEFEQKFGYRHHLYAVLEYIWKIPSFNRVFWELFEEGRKYYSERSEFSAFPRFINLLVNDSTFLLDEALQHLCKIRELEKEKNDGDWEKLSPQARQDKQRTLFQLGEMARGYNIMANETVHVLCYITKDITRPFASPCMVEQTASFLNYFLMHLVGPKRRDLKVKDFDKFHFKPKELVKNICQILMNLGTEKDFCLAVASDGRSYSPELFALAREVLIQLNMPEDFLMKFTELSAKFEKASEESKEEEDNMPEPPEEFVDPILGTLMVEPVRLPGSKKILNKSTIARHLLSDPKDPFNRSPLTLDMVEPVNDLKERIEQWMVENGITLSQRYTAKDCSG